MGADWYNCTWKAPVCFSVPIISRWRWLDELVLADAGCSKTCSELAWCCKAIKRRLILTPSTTLRKEYWTAVCQKPAGLEQFKASTDKWDKGTKFETKVCLKTVAFGIGNECSMPELSFLLQNPPKLLLLDKMMMLQWSQHFIVSSKLYISYTSVF